ncbi:MAG: hypothetical protein QM758_06455 [Armatimonas sp.]
MNLRTLTALSALLTLGALLPLSASAQKPDMDHKMGGKMMGGKMDHMGKKPMMGGSVWLCKDSKCYFSEADAKKMGYKNKMGHKLVKVKASQIPAGYKDGSKMMMDGKKMGGKMSGKMGKM